MKLVDYVEFLFSDAYKQSVIGMMLENLKYARDTVLPNHAMEVLGVPVSIQPRLRFRAGVVDDAIRELEGFEYHTSRGEDFEWLAKEYWKALGYPDAVDAHWLSQNIGMVEQAMRDINEDAGEDAYNDLNEFFEYEFFSVTDLDRTDLVVGEFAVDLPRTFWSGLDQDGVGYDVIDNSVHDCDTSYDYDYLRSAVIDTLSLYVDEEDLSLDLDNLGECIASSIDEAVKDLDLRLMHVNDNFDASLGSVKILTDAKQLNDAVVSLCETTSVRGCTEILDHVGGSFGCVFVKSLDEFAVSDIKRLKGELSSKGLPFVLVQEGRDIAVPSEYSSVFDHVYLLGCFCYASAKQDVKVEFKTYTGIVEFVNDNHYLIRDFGVLGVASHWPYLNVVKLDVGSGAEVRIPLDLFEDSYRDIRIQSRNAVRLTTPAWDGAVCTDPKLHLSLDYTDTVQVDFLEINRLFFTKKAYIGCDVEQLQSRKASEYLGKRFPSEFRCSGSLCIVEDGMYGVSVFSNSRYKYPALVAATISRQLSAEALRYFEHLKLPMGFSEAEPKRVEAYSNKIVWPYPENDFSGCAFYKCILVGGEPKNSVSILSLNREFDRTIAVQKRVVSEDEDFSLDEWL